MQEMDNAVKPLPVIKIDGEKVVGALVADRLVMFSRSGQPLADGFTFEIPKSAGKQVKVLLTDLQAREWTVKNGKKTVFKSAASSEDGALYFTASPGKYTVE